MIKSYELTNVYNILDNMIRSDTQCTEYIANYLSLNVLFCSNIFCGKMLFCYNY